MGDKDDMNKSIDVKLYTYDGYNECLASKTVVFIGDSRVRYQYMHLASYLKTKKFMKCMNGAEEFMHKHPTIKLHLISHPPTVPNVPNPHKVFNPNKLKCKVDRTTMNKNVPLTSEGSFYASWYYDSMHVISILNEEYNHQLVKKICPI